MISLSDSDLFNWVYAINNSKEFYSEVKETDIFTIAIQGPKSEKLAQKIFGKEISAFSPPFVINSIVPLLFTRNEPSSVNINDDDDDEESIERNEFEISMAEPYMYTLPCSYSL